GRLLHDRLEQVEGRAFRSCRGRGRFQLILHPSSLILHPSSLIPHPSSLIPHPSSFILHPSSLIPHPSRCQEPHSTRFLTPGFAQCYDDRARYSQLSSSIPADSKGAIRWQSIWSRS